MSYVCKNVVKLQIASKMQIVMECANMQYVIKIIVKL